MYEFALRDFIDKVRASGYDDDQARQLAELWIDSLVGAEDKRRPGLYRALEQRLAQVELF